LRLLIKIGGTLVDDKAKRTSLAHQIAAVLQPDRQIVVVHGGGKQLTKYLDNQGVESHFVNGLRVTGQEAMDAVVKILAGTVNKNLVGALRAAGVPAVGISGIDGRLTTAEQMSEELGHVGRVVGTDASVLQLLTLGHFVPVVACVAGDDDGQAWNINADQMALACAQAFQADRVIFLTDVPGVLGGNGSMIPQMTVDEAGGLIVAGVAKGGMQAKLEAASAAVRAGVASVVIVDGAEPDVLQRLLSGEPAGTEIRQSYSEVLS
jgi:acetylglutamate kinase